MAGSLGALVGSKNFKTKDAHSDILPRFLSVAGASVPRVQQLVTKPQTERKKGNMNLETLKELYVEELRDLYNARTNSLKHCRRWRRGFIRRIKGSFRKASRTDEGSCAEAGASLRRTRREDKRQNLPGHERLDRRGIGGLKADGEDSVLDAAIIVAAQKVEHYEIASYGSVRTFAQLLGQDKSAELLQQTLDEESEANELLNKLAEDIVNPEALMEPELASASSAR